MGGFFLRCVFSLLTHFQHLGGLIWHPCAPVLRKICLARSCCLSKGASLCGRAYELLHNPDTGVAPFLGCDSCSWFRCCAVYRAVFVLSIAWFRRRAVVHGQRCCSLPPTASELNVSLWCFCFNLELRPRSLDTFRQGSQNIYECGCLSKPRTQGNLLAIVELQN